MLRRTFGGLAAAGLVTGAAALGYSLWEARQFTLRRCEIPVLPRGSGPIRVLQLSDLHLTPSQSVKHDWLRSLGDLKPDLVIDTGDNVAHPEALPYLKDALGSLLDVPGVFVMGSNDYYAPVVKNPLRYLASGSDRQIRGAALPTDELRSLFVDSGWHDLDNHRASLRIRGQRLDFAGVDDPHIFRDRYEDVSGPVDPEASLTIGVTHAPYLRVLDAMANDGIPVVFAGHTHGGQVCVPGYGALTTNCDLPTRQAKGLSRHLTSWLHVSAGLGCSPYAPIRLACRPEVSLVTLVARIPADEG